jgi:chitin disaccharide deacetylase
VTNEFDEVPAGPRPRRLIVNADDFGRTPGINQGTIEAHLKGIVSSATVMVLEKSARDGIRQAQEQAPRLSLGLHFVMTGGGSPASAAISVPTLAPGGKFPRNAEAFAREIPEGEIRRELLAQIALFELAAGRPPTHLDSHHHAALHPSVQQVFAAVASGRGMPMRAASAKARDELRAAGLKVPDFFLSAFYGDGVTFDKLAALVFNVPHGTTELMCHPGHADAALVETSSYAREREKELAILCDPGIREVVVKTGIQLVAFGEL